MPHSSAFESTVADMQLIDIHGIARKAGIGRRTAFDLVKRSGFPAPRRLGPRILRWAEHEIDAYLVGLPPALDRIEPPRLTAAKASKRVGGASGGLKTPKSDRSPDTPRPAARCEGSTTDNRSVELAQSNSARAA